MKKIVLCIVLASLAFSAYAGEFRGVGGFGFGSMSYYDGDDELSADLSQVFVEGTYFLGATGPFMGVGFVRQEAGSFEFNDQALNLDDIESEITKFTVGYRSGQYGGPQFLVSGSLQKASVDGDASETVKSVFLGIEKAEEKGRIMIGGQYSAGDDTRMFGVQGELVLYLNQYLGVGGSIAYEIGRDKSMDNSMDALTVGLALELRVIR